MEKEVNLNETCSRDPLPGLDIDVDDAYTDFDKYTYSSSVITGRSSRGIRVMMAFRSNWPFPVGYLMFFLEGDHHTTDIRGNIADMYVPAGVRRCGAMSFLINELKKICTTIHTTSSTMESEIVLRKNGFVRKEAELDWVWIRSDEDDDLPQATD